MSRSIFEILCFSVIAAVLINETFGLSIFLAILIVPAVSFFVLMFVIFKLYRETKEVIEDNKRLQYYNRTSKGGMKETLALIDKDKICPRHWKEIN